MTAQSVWVPILIGIVVGEVAGELWHGFGPGRIWNVLIAIGGGLLASYLLTTLQATILGGIAGLAVTALAGAVVALYLAGVIVEQAEIGRSHR